MTGLTVYYGQGPGMFNDMRYYDYMQFLSRFVEENSGEYNKNSDWRTLNGGACEGLLIGGYSRNFAMILGNKYFNFNNEK